MIIPFRPHKVTIKKKVIKDDPDWDHKTKHQIICLDIMKTSQKFEHSERAEKTHPGSVPGAVEYDPQEDLLEGEEETDDEIITSEHQIEATNIWILLGNILNGEYRWFHITEVLFAGFIERDDINVQHKKQKVVREPAPKSNRTKQSTKNKRTNSDTTRPKRTGRISRRDSKDSNGRKST